SLRKLEHVKHQEAILGGLNRRQRNLGNSDITKLLDELDNETEAIKSGQEIGEELLSAKIQTKKGDEKLYQANDSFSQDSASQTVKITDAPVLDDSNGIPEKTTAVESGASYLTGKPLLVLNKDKKDDVHKWFLYYPLSTESDKQTP
ncbi:unnamed protein product, partial [Porites lobata]